MTRNTVWSFTDFISLIILFLFYLFYLGHTIVCGCGLSAISNKETSSKMPFTDKDGHLIKLSYRKDVWVP